MLRYSVKHCLKCGVKFCSAESPYCISCGRADRYRARKLTADQVRAIRALPHLKHTELAEMYGVTPMAIAKIRKGRTWAWVED